MIRKPSQVILFVALCLPCALCAQEVAYVDLIGVAPRTELRAPKGPDPICNNGVCTSGGIGSASVGDGAPGQNEPRALKITLISLHRLSYLVRVNLEMEVRIENAGTVDMEIPWSPSLSDLQPTDATAAFTYSSLYVTLGLKGDDGQSEFIEVRRLYGVLHRSSTMLTLQPGQWVRLRMEAVLNVPAAKLPEDGRWSANLTCGLQSIEFLPSVKMGGYSTSVTNQHPRVLTASPVELSIHPRAAKSQKARAAESTSQ
jgi:hypothetical protein